MHAKCLDRKVVQYDVDARRTTTVASLLFQKQVSLDAPGPTVMSASLACLKKTPRFLSLGEETITQEHLLNTRDTEYVTEHETA